jgi:hypothetical protein
MKTKIKPLNDPTERSVSAVIRKNAHPETQMVNVGVEAEVVWTVVHPEAEIVDVGLEAEAEVVWTAAVHQRP